MVEGLQLQSCDKLRLNHWVTVKEPPLPFPLSSGHSSQAGPSTQPPSVEGLQGDRAGGRW